MSEGPRRRRDTGPVRRLSAAPSRLGPARRALLRETLEANYRRFHDPAFLAGDPLAVALEHPPGPEREWIALLAALLASGRAQVVVDSARRARDRVLLGGARAVDLCRPEGFEDLANRLAGFRYRWVEGRALAATLAALGAAADEKGPVGAILPQAPSGSPEPLLDRIARVADEAELAAHELLEHPTHSAAPRRDLRWLLASPSRGGAAKRWMMWARWFSRSDGIDPGGRPELDPRELIIPLDTHVFRLTGFLGLHRRRVADRRTAEEITAGFRRLSPDDPLRYDFSLVRMGILGDCPGRRQLPGCAPCPIVAVCRA